MTRYSSTSAAPGLFPNTRWTAVQAVQSGCAESVPALEAICRAYWYPLYA
jgi:RNA polymerase sigma-70 factor (ECF subfamily)